MEERSDSCVFRYDAVWFENASIMAILSREEMKKIKEKEIDITLNFLQD